MAKKGKLPQVKADAKAAGWKHYIKTENDEKAAFDGCVVKPELGEHVVAFCEGYCRLSEGQWYGKSVVLMPWQKDELIMPLFAWVRPDGSRRFRRLSAA